MMLKLGVSPYASVAPVNGVFVFLKNAHAYTELELPADRFGIMNNGTVGSWFAEVNPLLGASPYPKNASAPFTVNSEEWYNLSFTIIHGANADYHLFYVNNTQVLSITVAPPYPVPYQNRTAFGEWVTNYSYGCFGPWYVRELSTSIVSSFLSDPSFLVLPAFRARIVSVVVRIETGNALGEVSLN